jgi:para-nitrobenzyl esterase
MGKNTTGMQNAKNKSLPLSSVSPILPKSVTRIMRISTCFTMKFSFLSLIALFIFSLSHAQNPGCDGTRYKADVFSSVKMTTVPYGPSTDHFGLSTTLAMDVYEPIGDNVAARPVVVLAHGGSFIIGAKGDLKATCERLAKRGYVVASIQYRLFPFFTLGFPDSTDIFDTATKAIGDMKAAIRYFREDAATNNQFKTDPNNIFIGGYSAGAVTALTARYLDPNDDIPAFLDELLNNNGGFVGNTGSASNKTYSSESKAVLNLSGGLYRSYWVDSTNVPLISIHGTADETVNFDFGLAANIAFLEGSKRVHARAEAVGVWNHLVTVPGGGHTNIYDQLIYKPFVDSFFNSATTLLESLACAVSGTTTLVQDESWSIMPNPVTAGYLSVLLPNDMPSAQIMIWDATGRQLASDARVGGE